MNFRSHTNQEINARERQIKRQSQIDNPEKLSTLGTQDEEKQNKNTTQYVMDKFKKYEPSYKQL